MHTLQSISKEIGMPKNYYPEETADYDTRSEKAGSKAKTLDRVAKAAYDNNRAYEGCARCVLHALQTHLNITDDQRAFTAAFKSSTALSAGVARKGETCGALIGALMAIGLEKGTESLGDFEGYVDTMGAASCVFDRFKEKYGAVKCFEIQEQLFGRRIDFFKEEEAEWWYRNEGLDKCPGVCAVAARLAAEEIFKVREEMDKIKATN
jgi:C_GCAxxG_C_C family probable redox protein